MPISSHMSVYFMGQKSSVKILKRSDLQDAVNGLCFVFSIRHLIPRICGQDNVLFSHFTTLIYTLIAMWSADSVGARVPIS